MLVKLIPGLEKYAMDSSNVTLLLLVVLATIVIKDIFEQKKLLKEYEAFLDIPYYKCYIVDWHCSKSGYSIRFIYDT